MFLSILDNKVIEDPSGSYQVGSDIEMPLLLERYSIAMNGIDIILNPIYAGKTNDEIIQMFEQVELDKIEKVIVGQLESSLISRLSSVFNECCKIIIDKRHLSDDSYNKIQRSYLMKYDKAVADSPMPLQAANLGLTVTEFNALIITKNDSFRANQALLFDILEEKRFTMTAMITSNRTMFTSELEALIDFPDEFEALIAV